MLARSVQYDPQDLVSIKPKGGYDTESEQDEEEKKQMVDPRRPLVEPSSLLQQIQNDVFGLNNGIDHRLNQLEEIKQ
jgi:hypothetical protein